MCACVRGPVGAKVRVCGCVCVCVCVWACACACICVLRVRACVGRINVCLNACVVACMREEERVGTRTKRL